MRSRFVSTFVFAFLLFVAAGFCHAQPTTPSATTNLPAPMNWNTEQDHRNMMEQLGIRTLRPGADGMNPEAPDYQNTDEARANPYPDLPDPLTLKNGEKVVTPEMWWKQRRPEIVEDFDREVYGRVPKNVPKVTWEVTSITRTNNGAVPVITKQLVGHVDNSSYPLINVNIQLTLTTPANAAGPVPVMLEFGFGNFGRRLGGFRRDESLRRDKRPSGLRRDLAADPIGSNWFCPTVGATPSSSRPVIRRTMALA